MSILEVIEWPEKVLMTKTEEVTKFDAKFKAFVQDMLDTMKDSKGIGLAANQVNSLQRVLIIKIDHDDNKYEDQEPEEKREWHGKIFVVVNPVITKRNGKTKYMEGCLSFPEMYDFVNRDDEVTVEYKDENGKDQIIEADGLLSICLQHEIDHLDGIVFIDRMSRMKSSSIRKKMSRRGNFKVMELAGAEK